MNGVEKIKALCGGTARLLTRGTGLRRRDLPSFLRIMENFIGIDAFFTASITITR